MKADERQEDGDHYLKRPISPWDIYEAYPDMDPWTANIIKYMLRWPDKGGLRDLRKARHTLDKLIEVQEDQRTVGERMADHLVDTFKSKDSDLTGAELNEQIRKDMDIVYIKHAHEEGEA